MKKSLLLITICMLALATMISCQKESAIGVEFDKSHQVNLLGEIQEIDIEPETKGLAIVAMPDWRNTSQTHIHLYENGIEGTNPKMTIDAENNRVAYFTATFGEGGKDDDEGEDQDIDAPIGGDDDEEDVDINVPINNQAQTKAVSYIYSGIIAPSSASNAEIFEVPAVQNPDPEISLIDPDADFLIGCNMAVSSTDSKNFKLDFKRPVALFRLALINLPKEEKISEIKLTADSELTGSFAGSDIDFVNGAAEFDKSAGSKTITLKYDKAGIGTIFYAYFVTVPTSAKFLSLEVTTDKYVYTKTISNSDVQTLTPTVFKSLSLDLKGSDKVATGEEDKEDEEDPQSGDSGIDPWEPGDTADM